MQFCIDTLSLPANLRTADGVLRLPALQITADAEVAAGQLLAQARAQAERLLEEAHRSAEAQVHAAEERTLLRARVLLQSLEQTHAAVLQRAQDLVIELAQRVFERLAAEMTPRARIESMLKRLQLEAPPRLVTPLLHVHPQDFDLLPALEWEVKLDPALTPGACRLEASSGEWCADFSAALSALNGALARMAQDASLP